MLTVMLYDVRYAIRETQNEVRRAVLLEVVGIVEAQRQILLYERSDLLIALVSCKLSRSLHDRRQLGENYVVDP